MTEQGTPTIRLRTGIEEARPLVALIYHQLKELLEKKPIVLFELVMCCRDREHVPWGKTGDDLRALSLLEPDTGCEHVRIHDSIRNIVCASVEGEGLDLVLRSPVNKE